MKAFPLNSIDEKNFCTNQGMDLRDYFAAKAMQSIIVYEEGCFAFKAIAEESYKVADAMMEARKAKND
jgi:hypothetical protein